MEKVEDELTRSNTDLVESQQSIDRVPESPPIHTQYSQSEDEQNDVEAQVSGNCLKENDNQCFHISYNDESTSTKSKDFAKNPKKGNSDVVIDIEEDEGDRINSPEGSERVKFSTLGVDFNGDSDIEFPEEEDAILVSAVANAENPNEDVEDFNEDKIQETIESEGVTSVLDLNSDAQTQEDNRQQELEKFKRFQPLDKIFPDVRFSEYNTVGFDLKNFTPGVCPTPYPAKFVPKWEPRYVPMPCCDENILLIRSRRSPLPPSTEGDNGTSTNDQDEPKLDTPPEPLITKVSVWNRINECFSNFPILCSQDIATAMRKYCRVQPELKALQYCIEQIMDNNERTQFFNEVIPFMTKLVLNLPNIVTTPLPILRKSVNHNITLSQKQIACLLANAFFSTFTKRFDHELDLPSINFKELFSDDGSGEERRLIVKAQKIRCLIHYFTRISTEMPSGVVTYTRKNLRHSNMPEWGKIDKGLTKFVPLISGTIEDNGAGMLMVDFANKIIGGGVLGKGAVQEEILFVIYPELILSRLFTEKLNFNEAVIVTGCERFSKYFGYSLSFSFDGDYQDVTPYDSKGRRCTQIVAIDALYIARPSFQFHPNHIKRELNKAFVGFSTPTTSPVAVATGKWGCGAFNGDPQLKAIIQLLAASHAGRDVAFFTFGDIPCLNDVTEIYNAIKEMKIKEVWNMLTQYHSLCCSTSKITRTLKTFCLQYANGQLLQLQQEETKALLREKTKMVPITNFYPSTKKKILSPTLDDANVAALINGIHKINSKQNTLSSGKRQREDEPLTEEQVGDILHQDDNSELESIDPDHIHEIPKQEQISTAVDDNAVVSPKSSKRPKRLQDFYENFESCNDNDHDQDA